MKPLCIATIPEELDQGLFGQIFYHVFSILPYLHDRGIYPAWEVRTKHYGDPPDFMTVPGALDLAYLPPAGPYRTVSLFEMRRRHAHVLGNDWEALNRLWCSYFKIPQRIVLQADRIFPAGRALGIHYRGTDKQTTSWDSNPISPVQFITLIRDFLDNHDGFDVIVAATDEYSFIEKLRSQIKLPVVNLGEVDFHMAAEHAVTRAEKTDRAILDCLLLSRCDCLIETSSALPSFAKLLNPGLEIYRCAASKLFGKLYTNTPYFPVAHVPVLPVTKAASAEILLQTMQGDWAFNSKMARYRDRFVSSPRWKVNHAVYSVAENLMLDRLLARFMSGHY